MLTLTRAVGETFVLYVDGRRIATMQVVNIRGREVKVRFDAPGIKILRGELRNVEEEDQHESPGERST
jgi:sRNA-binding carbon storage regulator CsrA